MQKNVKILLWLFFLSCTAFSMEYINPSLQDALEEYSEEEFLKAIIDSRPRERANAINVIKKSSIQNKISIIQILQSYGEDFIHIENNPQELLFSIDCEVPHKKIPSIQNTFTDISSIKDTAKKSENRIEDPKKILIKSTEKRVSNPLFNKAKLSEKPLRKTSSIKMIVHKKLSEGELLFLDKESKKLTALKENIDNNDIDTVMQKINLKNTELLHAKIKDDYDSILYAKEKHRFTIMQYLRKIKCITEGNYIENFKNLATRHRQQHVTFILSLLKGYLLPNDNTLWRLDDFFTREMKSFLVKEFNAELMKMNIEKYKNLNKIEVAHIKNLLCSIKESLIFSDNLFHPTKRLFFSLRYKLQQKYSEERTQFFIMNMVFLRIISPFVQNETKNVLLVKCLQKLMSDEREFGDDNHGILYKAIKEDQEIKVIIDEIYKQLSVKM